MIKQLIDKIIWIIFTVYVLYNNFVVMVIEEILKMLIFVHFYKMAY